MEVFWLIVKELECEPRHTGINFFVPARNSPENLASPSGGLTRIEFDPLTRRLDFPKPLCLAPD